VGFSPADSDGYVSSSSKNHAKSKTGSSSSGPGSSAAGGAGGGSGPQKRRVEGSYPLKRIVAELMDACVSDDPKNTGGIGGDNITCIVVLFNKDRLAGLPPGDLPPSPTKADVNGGQKLKLPSPPREQLQHLRLFS